MRCYSHLSDDEREQIVWPELWAVPLARSRKRSAVRNRRSRGNSPAMKPPSGRYSPLHAAGAYQLRRRREALIERDRALRTFVVDRLAEGWTPSKFQAG